MQTDEAKPITPEQLAEYDAETVRLLNDAESLVRDATGEWETLKSQTSDAKKRAEAKQDELCKLIRERQEGRGKRPAPTLLDLIPAEPKWRELPLSALKVDAGILNHLSFEAIANVGMLHDEITSFNPSEGTPYDLAIADVATLRIAIQELRDAEEAPAIPEDLWRSYPIDRWSRFGLTAKDIEKLAAGEIKRDAARHPITTVGDLSAFTAPAASGWTHKLADIKGIGAAGADRISEAETRFWAYWNDGGQEEFARERGLIRGNATAAGTGSEGVSPGELLRLADDGNPNAVDGVDGDENDPEDTAEWRPEDDGENLSHDIRTNGI